MQWHSTVCPRSGDPFYVVTYYIKWVTTSWTDGTIALLQIILKLDILYAFIYAKCRLVHCQDKSTFLQTHTKPRTSSVGADTRVSTGGLKSVSGVQKVSNLMAAAGTVTVSTGHSLLCVKRADY